MANVCFKCLSVGVGPHMMALRSSRANQRFSSLLLAKSQSDGMYNSQALLHTSSSLRGLKKRLKLDNINVNLQKEKHVRYSQEYIDEKIAEYDLGMRRLAQMMGREPDTFTRKDVKNAISYLFPSSLFSVQARPTMDHPSQAFPAEVVVDTVSPGRPSNYLFYTLHGSFYQALHEIYSAVMEAQRLDDERYMMGLEPERELNLDDSNWIRLKEFEKKFDGVTARMYRSAISQLKRLADEPYAYEFEELIMRYRAMHVLQTLTEKSLPKVHSDGNREYTVTKGYRKTAVADVKLYNKGSGKVTVNGEKFEEFFPLKPDRSKIMTPFNLFHLNQHFDVEASVIGALQGEWERSRPVQDLAAPKSSMAGAIRLGISLGMQSFVDEEKREIMRRGFSIRDRGFESLLYQVVLRPRQVSKLLYFNNKIAQQHLFDDLFPRFYKKRSSSLNIAPRYLLFLAGLLTRDVRVRERKKPGQWKARKKFTWKKR